MSTTAPTTADITHTAAGTHDVLRNLNITQCYHELSFAVRAHTGPGANWCTFATWASKQAGHTIRKEDLADAVRLRLTGSPDHDTKLAAVGAALRSLRVVREVESIVDAVMRALDADAAFDRAAEAVAEGNRMVFEEIAHQFARFLEAIGAGGGLPPERFAAFVAALRPGEPPDGQRLLRDAFAEYRDALAEPDPKMRAERLFHANLLIGLHEQTRLQPQIAAALDAAFDAGFVRRRIAAELLPASWRRVRYLLAAWIGRRPPLDDAIDTLLSAVRRELRHVITATAMTLNLPDGRVVRLGRDIRASYPASLVTITNAPLAALLRRIDPSPDGVAGSGARDWADLDDRVHLIAELFRCYHEWQPLFDPPFTEKEVEALRSGRRPGGPL